MISLTHSCLLLSPPPPLTTTITTTTLPTAHHHHHHHHHCRHQLAQDEALIVAQIRALRRVPERERPKKDNARLKALLRERRSNIPEEHPLLKSCLMSWKRHSINAPDRTSTVWPILARGNLESAARVVGPLLEHAGITDERLALLYDGGRGSMKVRRARAHTHSHTHTHTLTHTRTHTHTHTHAHSLR
jgi:hypothetical protein